MKNARLFMIMAITVLLTQTCQKENSFSPVTAEWNGNELDAKNLISEASLSDTMIFLWLEQEKAKKPNLHELNPINQVPDWESKRVFFSEHGVHSYFTISNESELPMQLIFSKYDDSDEIYALSAYYILNEAYYQVSEQTPSSLNFTGNILLISSADKIIRVFTIEQGSMVYQRAINQNISEATLLNFRTVFGSDEIQALEIVPDDNDENGGCCCGAHCGGRNCGGCNGSGNGSNSGGGSTAQPGFNGGSWNSSFWTIGWGNHSNSGGNNNNNGSNNNPSTTGGGGGTHGDAADIFQIKSTTLRAWMNANNVPEEFFHLLYDCVTYLVTESGVEAENSVNEGCVEDELEHLAAYHLNQGFMEGHFSSIEYQELSELSNTFPLFPLSFGLPRAEYINQIDKIQQYLEKRHSDYGEAAQYLADLLPFLIQTEQFTSPEVYQVYLLATDWLNECRYNTLSSIVRNVLSATKPFIEMALIETGFQILAEAYTVTASASRRIVEVLPLPVKNSSQLVWNRITATSLSYRANTIIPETFKVTTESGQQFYVQYSATSHMHELVALRGGAATRPWFESQRALRSQLVVDDFARAIDDIT